MNRNMKAINWAMGVRGLDPGPWRLLMVLCGHVGKEGYNVWPSFASMAEKAEISRASAKRFVALLIEKRLIEIAGERWRPNGGRSVNVYRIMVGEIDVSDVGPDEEDEFLEPSDPRVKLNRGQGHSSDPGARVTGEPSREPLSEGTSQPEGIPPHPSDVSPPRDLLGHVDIVSEAPPTIVEHVLSKWKALVADFPRTHEIRILNDSRLKAIVRRAAEGEKAFAGKLTSFEVWDLVFDAIRNDRWLRGESEPTREYATPFALNIDYILRPKVFARTLERALTNELDRRATSDPTTGRTFGPGEQAAREALSRLRAGGERAGR